jgi:DNA-binding MarR family transcriptional regulator
MSIDTYNRVGAHADFTKLTLSETLVLKEIAARLNGTKADLMRLGVRYLASATGVSERQTARAITSLIAKGFLSATQASKRTARVFIVEIDCPANCKKLKQHYSPAEKKAKLAARNSPEPTPKTGYSEPLSVDIVSSLSVDIVSPECGHSVLTNTELNKEMAEQETKNKNTRNSDPVTALNSEPENGVLVSISEWLKVCLSALAKVSQDQFSEQHRELENDPHAYHLSANDFLKAKLESGSTIGNYTAYLYKLIMTNPHELMRTAAGSPKTLKKLKAYLTKQFDSAEWKEQHTREPLHNYPALVDDLMELPECGEWVEIFAKHRELGSARYEPLARQLLAQNPTAYKPLERLEPANAY